MRFYYVALAVAFTLLSSTNTATADAEKNHITQTTPEIIGAAQIDGVVKRSLRFHDKEEDSLDSLDDNEERGKASLKGINVQQLLKKVKAKGMVIPVQIDQLNSNFQKKILATLKTQDITQKQLATKLGLKSVTDNVHRNAGFFAKYKHLFREG